MYFILKYILREHLILSSLSAIGFTTMYEYSASAMVWQMDCTEL
jgi:hypothetical protein